MAKAPAKRTCGAGVTF
uniref:Uncharacterized protein n=1 Tax=Anguilla anguilla TaxID=7936 RepID=A0A0E9VHJ3_ANGAN